MTDNDEITDFLRQINYDLTQEFISSDDALLVIRNNDSDTTHRLSITVDSQNPLEWERIDKFTDDGADDFNPTVTTLEPNGVKFCLAPKDKSLINCAGAPHQVSTAGFWEAWRVYLNGVELIIPPFNTATEGFPPRLLYGWMSEINAVLETHGINVTYSSESETSFTNTTDQSMHLEFIALPVDPNGENPYERRLSSIYLGYQQDPNVIYSRVMDGEASHFSFCLGPYVEGISCVGAEDSMVIASIVDPQETGAYELLIDGNVVVSGASFEQLGNILTDNDFYVDYYQEML